MGLFRKRKRPDPKAEERLFKEIEENGGLEANDIKAMILSGLLVFLPATTLVLSLFLLLAFLFF